jgi:transcriptional regulator with XRE-family HTH domain
MTTKYTNQRPKVQPPVAALAVLRRSHAMTQPDVVARIKEATGRIYTVGALSALEGGHRGGSAQFLTDVAAVFGLEADDLWTSYVPRIKDKEAAA